MRRRAHQNERAREPRGGKLLGEQRTHGVTEQHRLWGKRFQDGGEIGAILGETDADKLPVGAVFASPMPDQIGRVNRPALALEHSPECVEAPAACRRAVQHHDVLSHSLLPIPRFRFGRIAGPRSVGDTR